MRVAVVHLVGSMTLGGAEKLTRLLVDGVDSSRFDSSVCCLVEGGEYAEQLMGLGRDVTILGMTRRLDPLGLVAGLVGLHRLWALLRRERPDVLHLHLFRTSLLGSIVGRLAGIPVIVANLHRIEYPRAQRLLCRPLSWLLDKIVVDSRAVKDLYVAELMVSPTRIEVVHNGIDTREFTHAVDANQAKESLGLPEEARVVGIIARLVPEKGHEYLIRAMQQVAAVRPNTYLLVVGDGVLEDSLRQLAAEVGIGRRTAFLEGRSDLVTLLSAIDVFVLPSSWEGFGIILAEAMYMEVPVISTSVGGATEVVEDGVSGVLVPFGDVDRLAKAILAVLSNPLWAAQLGRCGRQRVRRLFTKEVMCKQYEGLYTALWNRRLGDRMGWAE